MVHPVREAGIPAGLVVAPVSEPRRVMRIVRDWSAFPNFAAHEFRCKHTGRHGMDEDFLTMLQALRTAFGKPLVINSGYRHRTHPIEAAKASPGAHATGQAADIAIGPGSEVNRLVHLALDHGFSGIGISQRAGRGRFVHLDTLPRVAMWSY
jgi:zinc D-Ala-D-Ala carboxypeptidase